jgi:hypothetical protein
MQAPEGGGTVRSKICIRKKYNNNNKIKEDIKE